MIDEYLVSALLNHLWQSTLFAAALGVLTLAFRQSQARIRYALWLIASLKFLFPFTLLVNVGHSVGWAGASRVTAPQEVSFAVEQITAPATTIFIQPAASAQNSSHNWPLILLALWACGFVAMTGTWCIRWFRIHAELRLASPLLLPGGVRVRSLSGSLEPGVFGILHPVLVFPEGMADRLTEAELTAILTHELCHVRRRDNLTAALHMVVEAVFWFHPLIWWIGARLIEERERACDEEVLRRGSQPQTYAEGILKTCKFYLSSPLPCVSGVSGSDLKKRISRIMTARMTDSLGFGRKLLLALAGTAAIAGPVAFGVVNIPASRPQSTEPFAPAPSAEVVRVVSMKLAESQDHAVQPSMIVGESSRSNVGLVKASDKADDYFGPKAAIQIMPHTDDLPSDLITKPMLLQVKVHIDRTGRVTTASLLGFREENALSLAVLSAAKRWLFQAATLRGQPVESDYYIDFPLEPKDAHPSTLPSPLAGRGQRTFFFADRDAQQAQAPQFEVASIKPTDPSFSGTRVDIPLNDSIVRMRGMTLKALIELAYSPGFGLLHPSLVSGGPKWYDADRYDIVAKPSRHGLPSQEERKQMLRSLLAERFKLTVHREPKEITAFALTVGKKGATMKECSPDSCGTPSIDLKGMTISGQSASMSELAAILQPMIPLVDPSHADLPVVDRTGLMGRFDFNVEFANEEAPSDGHSSAPLGPNVPNLFTALQEKLGLKLALAKTPVEAIVIDHAEKASEN